MINSTTNGKLDEYLKLKMQEALDRNESEKNTGKIDLSQTFSTIFDDNSDYPLGKHPHYTASAVLTFA